MVAIISSGAAVAGPWGPAMLGCLVCAAAVKPALAAKGSAPLLAAHVVAMAPMLPLGAAGITAVRLRYAKPTSGKPSRSRNQRLVKIHFAAAAIALYASVPGLAAIFAHKRMLNKPHLTTLHSRLGVLTIVLWFMAYMVAQANVWRVVIAARPFRLVYKPRWVWASTRHRQFGVAAMLTSVGAVASGLNSAWALSAIGQLGSRLLGFTTVFVGAWGLRGSLRSEVGRVLRKPASSVKKPKKRWQAGQGESGG